jgi:biotin carboxyl carrier protein
MLYDVNINGQTMRLELTQSNSGQGWRCRLDDQELLLDAAFVSPDTISLIYEGKTFELRRERRVEGTQIRVNGESYDVEVYDPRSFRGRKRGAASSAGPLKLLAPMPGKVVRVLVREESTVEAGQGILVVEAMKMQNELKSPKNGTVRKIMTEAGASVNAGDILAIVE